MLDALEHPYHIVFEANKRLDVVGNMAWETGSIQLENCTPETAAETASRVWKNYSENLEWPIEQVRNPRLCILKCEDVEWKP